MKIIRDHAKKIFLTANTIRYRIELRVLHSIIARNCEGQLGETLLDAGAGSGEMSLRLLRAGCCKSLTAIEPFEDNYAKLVVNYGSTPRTKTIQASLDAIPLEDESIDAVVSTQVFEHIPDDHAAAKEISRILRSGGYALISTPHPPEIFPNPEHVRPGYTEEEMRDLFAAYGLKLVDTEYFFTLPTLRRLTAAMELGLLGRFFTISWADREKHTSREERKSAQPYGIACLFRKESPVQ